MQPSPSFSCRSGPASAHHGNLGPLPRRPITITLSHPHSPPPPFSAAADGGLTCMDWDDAGRSRARVVHLSTPTVLGLGAQLSCLKGAC